MTAATADAAAAASLPDIDCYLNGEFGPLREAKVSVMDRGFVFGDGIYEVVPVYGQRLFRVDEHMARLERSLAQVRIPNPHPREAWLGLMRQLVAGLAAARGTQDQLVYLQITRGVAPRDHVMPAGITPTVFMMANPLKAVPAELRRTGVACVTAPDFRWERGDIKSISLLGNVLARQISADVEAVETLMLRDGFLTEASASNAWIVKDGVLIGPPRSGHVLEGIRVELLRELCSRIGIGYTLRPITEQELRGADEVLLSSATKEVLAVTRLDGEPVGHGESRGVPGPVCQTLYQAYQDAKRQFGV